MYICMCLYVCTCLCMLVCIYVCECVYTFVYVYTYVCLCVCCICLCMCVLACVCISTTVLIRRSVILPAGAGSFHLPCEFWDLSLGSSHIHPLIHLTSPRRLHLRTTVSTQRGKQSIDFSANSVNWPLSSVMRSSNRDWRKQPWFHLYVWRRQTEASGVSDNYVGSLCAHIYPNIYWHSIHQFRHMSKLHNYPYCSLRIYSYCFIYTSVCLHLHVYTLCMPGTFESRGGGRIYLVVNWTRVLGKSRKHCRPPSHLPSPHLLLLN